MRPFGFVLSATATPLSRAHLVIHCLLVEAADGLVLVDTGYGMGDAIRPARLVRAFRAVSGSPRDPRQTAAWQIARMGYSVDDVRHVLLTHLHLDHAGGLPDFPRAQVHLLAAEHAAALRPGTFSERYYVPAHWQHWPRWVLHRPQGETWFGLEGVRVPEIMPETWLIPLVGHTRGHCGVAVQRPQGWLLHCGDAYLNHGDIYPIQSERRTPRWIAPLARRLFPHVPRLRALARQHGDKVRLFCSHDPGEFASLQRRS